MLTKKGGVILHARGYQIVEIKMGSTLSALEKIRSHVIRTQYILPKRSWLEVVSLRLLQDKLSREPTFLQTFLRTEERQLLNSLDEKERFLAIAEKYALKRALRIILFTRNMQELEIQTGENNERFCHFKGKTIYLATKKIDNYVLALASYRHPVSFVLRKEQ